MENQKKQKKVKIDMHRKIPISDCIVAEIDQDGNFNGFKIRPEMTNILFWRGDGDVSEITKIIRISNYLNRLLLEDDNEYVL